MQSVLISIRPQWCELICNGKKTIEVRKSRPKLETPFKCYIYETRGKTDTAWMDEDGHFDFHGRGKVIGEFVCDYVKMEAVGYIDHVAGYHGLESGTCLTAEQLMEYGKWAFLYGWHISALQIYDKPKELSEFTKYGYDTQMPCCRTFIPPQSWYYVEELEEPCKTKN